jgi:hypothetical protein
MKKMKKIKMEKGLKIKQNEISWYLGYQIWDVSLKKTYKTTPFCHDKMSSQACHFPPSILVE